MSIHTVLAHLTPLARQLRASVLPGGGDPSTLFNAIVEAGYLVAAADGNVDDTELKTLKSAVRALSEDELTTRELDELMDDLVDLRKAEGEAARCRAVGEVLHVSKASEEGIFLAAAIAYVSGGLSEPELAVMERISKSAQISGAAMATIATSVRDEIARHSRS